MSALEQLVSAGSAPLGPDYVAARSVADPLAPLWRLRNGFYAFESALHVLPSAAGPDTMDVEHWNRGELWRDLYRDLATGHRFFAEDIFGGQFSVLGDSIYSWDPETGDAERLADDVEGWARVLLSDYEFLTGYAQARDWQAVHGPLAPGLRLVPRRLFALGGEFEIANLAPVSAAEGMRARAAYAAGLVGLPDGTQVSFTVPGGDEPAN